MFGPVFIGNDDTLKSKIKIAFFKALAKLPFARYPIIIDKVHVVARTRSLGYIMTPTEKVKAHAISTRKDSDR